MITDDVRSIALLFLLITSFTARVALADEPGADSIVVNGETLNRQEIDKLESELDTLLEPGRYVVDIASGCWANITKNESHCEPIEDQSGTVDEYAVTFSSRPVTKKFVSINGIVLDQGQIAGLEAYVGTPIIPGQYLVNYLNGCWMNVTNGQRGCPNANAANGSMYNSSQGSGEWNGNGDWSHWSDAAGGGVGGTSDGCVYAFGWSNC